MSSFFILLFLCLTLNYNFHLSVARHVKNLPSAVVVGTVYCDTCFQQDISKNTRFISGASVAVKCGEENSRPEFYQEVKTNKNGEFKVHLPFSVGKHVKKIEKCSVKLISSNEPYCAVASTATSSTLHLKSRKEGIHIFSAGFFSFKPQNQPNLCNQKPRIQNSKEFNSKKIPSIPEFTNPSFPPPLQDPTIPALPQNPLMPNLPPLPQLPPLPNLPPLPPLLPPLPGKISTPTTALKNNQVVSDKKEAKPDFFFPPPVLPPLPPLPFQPPPSPLIPPVLPPNPLQPPSSPSPSFPIPIPPLIPGLNPPPSSPPPSLPIPLPPVVPLPPVLPPGIPGIPPGVPGIPPASSSKATSP